MIIKRNNFQQGFTLIEILIALFIFSIVSLLLATAFHNIINIQSRVEENAQRLRELQFTLLIISHDVTQAVDRPILNETGKEEGAFIGDKKGFTFTHLGYANPLGTSVHSNLQRENIKWKEGVIFRTTWDVLDKVAASLSHTRPLLTGVSEAEFQYLDQEKHFHDHWPVVEEQHKFPLPNAIKLTFVIKDWGKIEQLYVIPANPAI